MSQVTICLAIAVCLILVMNIECAVIKVQEIPLSKDVVMKIVVKEDTDGDAFATIKILSQHKKKTGKGLLPKLIEKFVKPSDDFVPDFSSRNGIRMGRCPQGKTLHGPVCV